MLSIRIYHKQNTDTPRTLQSNKKQTTTIDNTKVNTSGMHACAGCCIDSSSTNAIALNNQHGALYQH